MPVGSILIGSGNAHKIRELELLLARHGVHTITLDSLKERPPEPAETGATFEENARQKALDYARATGLRTLADDSGLEVDALDGSPGIYSARYAGPGATDAENNQKLLERMEGVADDARSARYVAVVVLASPERVLIETRGECAGSILRGPRGAGGFGYDPLFLVPSYDQTFAELGRDVKSRISHRAEALKLFARELPMALE